MRDACSWAPRQSVCSLNLFVLVCLVRYYASSSSSTGNSRGKHQHFYTFMQPSKKFGRRAKGRGPKSSFAEMVLHDPQPTEPDTTTAGPPTELARHDDEENYDLVAALELPDLDLRTEPADGVPRGSVIASMKLHHERGLHGSSISALLVPGDGVVTGRSSVALLDLVQSSGGTSGAADHDDDAPSSMDILAPESFDEHQSQSAGGLDATSPGPSKGTARRFRTPAGLSLAREGDRPFRRNTRLVASKMPAATSTAVAYGTENMCLVAGDVFAVVEDAGDIADDGADVEQADHAGACSDLHGADEGDDANGGASGKSAPSSSPHSRRARSTRRRPARRPARARGRRVGTPAFEAGGTVAEHMLLLDEESTWALEGPRLTAYFAQVDDYAMRYEEASASVMMQLARRPHFL